jgi:hypothetical protein
LNWRGSLFRARVKRQGIAMKSDILGVDDAEFVLVELLPRFSQDDVDEFIEKLTRFKIAFPLQKLSSLRCSGRN